MPFLLLFLILPFILVAWIIHYRMQKRDQDQLMNLREAKAIREAIAARPLKDFVASISKDSLPPKITLFPSGRENPPTLGNIARFASLRIRTSHEAYYIRDFEGNIYGPSDQGTLISWIEEQRVNATTLASNHSNGPWVALGSIRAFQKSFGAAISSSLQPRENRFSKIRFK